MTQWIAVVVLVILTALFFVTKTFALLLAAALAGVVACAAQWPRTRNALLLAGTLLICLLGAELFFTLQDEAEGEVAFSNPATRAPTTYWSVHPEFGVMPLPGRYQARKEGETGSPVYEALYTIGDDGFRATPQPPQAGEADAFFLGGSSTFGEGLNDDETLPHLWSSLNEGYRVHNKGVSGWGLHQAYAVWKAEILEPGAVVVVQTAPWDSDRSACLPRFSGLSPRFSLENGELVQAGKCRSVTGSSMVDALLMRSHLVQKLYDAAYRMQSAGKLDLYLALLKKMQALAEERGQCLVVAFNRAARAYLSSIALDNAEIVGALQDAGIRLVDVSLADPIEELDQAYFIAGDGHPTAAANQVKARLLTGATSLCPHSIPSASARGPGTRDAASPVPAARPAAQPVSRPDGDRKPWG
jgi:hypothetical protein